MSRAKKAVILARVSTEEQEKGYSIDAQLHRLKEYCLRKELEVIESFTVVESSTRGERKQFHEMMTFVKRQKECIAVVADKVDRVQRSFKEFPILDSLVQGGRIELHFNSEGYVIHKDSVSQDRFMWSIGVVLAQGYVDSLRDNVKRSIAHKLRNGEWVSQAPIGYEHFTNYKGKADIRIDPIRAPLVKQLFERYATGCSSLSELSKYAKEIGLNNSRGNKGNLRKSHLHKILQDPFYYGIMKVKKTGEEFPHRYDTIITKSLFDICQIIRTGKGRPHSRYGKREYLFRGLLTCANTAKLCTAETHKRTYKNGEKAEWTYVRTYSEAPELKKMWVREDEVEQQVLEILESLAIKDSDYLKDIMSWIRNTHDNKKVHHKKHTAALKKEHTELETKIEKLMELRMSDEISKEEFVRNKKRYKDRQLEIVELIHAYDVTEDEFNNKLILLINIASGASRLFRGSDTHEKREMLSFIFQNLKLNGKKLEYTMRYPFSLFADANKTGEWCALDDSNV
jgi:site-specific DNA recombinase